MLKALVTLLWASAVTVPPAACPRADAVAVEIDRLGASAALAALGWPEVTVEGPRMHVVLRGRDGSLMGSREVAAPEACDERVSVAAVFIAAWVGAWSTNPLPNLPSRDPATPAPAAGEPKPRDTALTPIGKVASPLKSSPALRSVVTGQPIPPSSPPPPPTTPPRPPDSATSQSREAALRTRLSPKVEVAGLAFGTHDGDAGTFGAGVFAAYAIADALAVGALLETTGTREAAVGPAMATYRTSRLGVGASVRRRWGRLFGDAGIFPELTMLVASGQPLAIPRDVSTWGAAVDVRGRMGLALGRFLPFLFAGASGAMLAERLTLDDLPTDATTLPRWNFSAGAGLAVLLGAKE
jgi:hypothetical protein